jgi:hypothetical protein
MSTVLNNYLFLWWKRFQYVYVWAIVLKEAVIKNFNWSEEWYFKHFRCKWLRPRLPLENFRNSFVSRKAAQPEVPLLVFLTTAVNFHAPKHIYSEHNKNKLFILFNTFMCTSKQASVFRESQEPLIFMSEIININTKAKQNMHCVN